MIGDFNAILMAKENLSTRPPSSLLVKDFNDMILSTGLKGLGFSGNRFTLANNRQGQAYVAARLDRAISNSTRLDFFDDPIVNHLPRLSSDHSPILLSHRKILPQKNIPFKLPHKISLSNLMLCGCHM